MSRSDSGVAAPGGCAVETAARELVALRRLAVQRGLVAVTAAAVAGLVASVDMRVAVALGAGAIVEAGLAVVSACDRRQLLLALAAHRDSYVLAEVRGFGASLTTPKRRLALARSIAAVLRNSGTFDSIYILDRVAVEAPALTAIARALADDSAVVEPSAMAALVQLLTDGNGSPLLNPAASRDELRGTVAGILAGIHPRQEARGDEARHVGDRAA